MPKRKALQGEIVEYDAPYWTPLEQHLSRGDCSHYMWMGEILLENGVRVHAYKHYNTRRYLHLAEDGTSWLYVNDRYEQTDVPAAEQHAAETSAR